MRMHDSPVFDHTLAFSCSTSILIKGKDPCVT